MKKLLLTLVLGMVMLSLPAIASATLIGVGGFDDYSGFTASVTVNGFRTYSTAAGATAGFRQFSWTEKADRKLTGPENTTGIFNGVVNFISIWLNAHTIIQIDAANAIAPANGKVIKATGGYMIYHTTGAMTITPNTGLYGPPAFGNATTVDGLTGTMSDIYGSCTITAENGLPYTHNMVLSIASPTAEFDVTAMYTSSGGSWNQTGYNTSWVAATVGYPRMTSPAASISPITLKSTSYSSPWWNLNSGSIIPPPFVLMGFF